MHSYNVAPEDPRGQALLPLYLISAGAQHNQETRIRPLGASFYHIFVIEEGAGLFEWDGRRQILQAGNAYFIPKGFPISYQRQGEIFRTGWVGFDGSQAEKMLEYFQAAPMESIPAGTVSPAIIACCQMIHRGASPAQLSAHLYQIIISFFETARQRASIPALEKAKEYARKHLEKDLSVSDLAQAADISASLLHRLFQQEKTTPILFLRRERIRLAKELLLQSPEHKIAEIARACGFSDCAYFCKIFRQEAGFSPLQYRKNLG